MKPSTCHCKVAACLVSESNHVLLHASLLAKLHSHLGIRQEQLQGTLRAWRTYLNQSEVQAIVAVGALPPFQVVAMLKLDQAALQWRQQARGVNLLMEL